MPQFMVDWQLWWLSFWVAHPIIFWAACSLALIPAAISYVMRRK